jgi:ribonuclease E
MRDESHKRDVERQLWETLKNDRARMKMLRMSRFGIIEMTRQRMRRNIEFTDYQTCPTCKGLGQIRNPESTILETLRRVRSMAVPGKARRIVVRLHPQNLIRLQNERRQEIVEIEKNWGGHIVLEAGEDLIDNIDIKCYKH